VKGEAVAIARRDFPELFRSERRVAFSDFIVHRKIMENVRQGLR